MKLVAAIFSEIVGLFIEDRALALGVAGVLLVATLCSLLLRGGGPAAGVILLFGCVGVLAATVVGDASR